MEDNQFITNFQGSLAVAMVSDNAIIVMGAHRDDEFDSIVYIVEINCYS